jgi:hypothetical protein
LGAATIGAPAPTTERLVEHDAKVVRPMGSVNSGTAMLLDDFLPEWEFREQHSRRVSASTHEVRTALLTTTAGDLPFSGLMLALRLAPAALLARRWPGRPSRPLLDGFIDLGFVELARTDAEIVLGAVGQFWRLREEMVPLSTSDDFVRFDEPGFAKGAINFRVTDEGDSVLLSTETRVKTTDAGALRSFRPYWVPVRAVGGLMRIEMLSAVARKAGVISRRAGRGAT